MGILLAGLFTCPFITTMECGVKGMAANDKSWRAPLRNPHTAQVYLTSPGYQFWETPAFRRVLCVDSDPGREYQRRDGKMKSAIHWGQRKLLLSEIEFLTLIGDEALAGGTVVYAGAAPGTHVGCLSEMFPRVNFVLVDPAPFTVKPSAKIRLISDLFTDELAMELKDQYGQNNVYFVSDIRTADPDRDTPGESERKIKSDMEAQMRWHLMMESKRSMFKFRLPWDDESSEYLDGDVYLPVWGPQTTTECRLVTRAGQPRAMRTYDHKKYESQMFYFNSLTRVSLYEHDVTAPGVDHCYDCRAEVHILGEYTRKADALRGDICEMSQFISQQISHRRTLCDPNPDKEKRKIAIRKRQYEDGTVPAHEAAEERRTGRRIK